MRMFSTNLVVAVEKVDFVCEALINIQPAELDRGFVNERAFEHPIESIGAEVLVVRQPIVAYRKETINISPLSTNTFRLSL